MTDDLTFRSRLTIANDGGGRLIIPALGASVTTNTYGAPTLDGLVLNVYALEVEAYRGQVRQQPIHNIDFTKPDGEPTAIKFTCATEAPLKLRVNEVDPRRLW